ncbi:MAG: septal ring lytic transglycosylase RlpA family protein [Bacteroidota bacterium]
MKSTTKALLFVTMMLLAGFTVLKEEMKTETASSKSGLSDMTEEEIKVEFNTLEKKSAIQFVEKGSMTASWYGPKFHGKRTASGEKYDQMGFTAAHRSYKFGTLLKLTNTKNNRTVIVRVNDRGPFRSGRQLDLSKGAATELGMMNRGVVKLDVEEVTLSNETLPLIALK